MFKHFIIFLFIDKELKKKIEFLKSIPFFSSLTLKSLKKFSSMLYKKEYLKGEIIFKQGESAKLFCMLQSGKIELTCTDGSSAVIEKTGTAFGQKYLFFKDEIYINTAKCLANSQVYILHKYDIEVVMKEDKNIGFELSRFILEDLYSRLGK